MREIGLSLATSHATGITHLLTSPDFWVALAIQIVLVILVLLVTYALARFARGRLRYGLERGGLQVNVAVLLARLLWIGIWILGVVGVLYVAGVGLTPLAAVIGVLGLAASLALQQLLQNLVAGVYLLAERPFRIGDLIAVVGPGGANHQGRVEDIQMRTTLLRSPHDELILVPNSSVFAGVVTNRTVVGGYVTTAQITVPRANDPSTVRQTLIPALRGVQGVLDHPAPELHVEKVDQDTWSGSLVFWVETETAAADAVWAVAQACPSATIDAAGALS